MVWTIAPKHQKKTNLRSPWSPQTILSPRSIRKTTKNLKQKKSPNIPKPNKNIPNWRKQTNKQTNQNPTLALGSNAELRNQEVRMLLPSWASRACNSHCELLAKFYWHICDVNYRVKPRYAINMSILCFSCSLLYLAALRRGGDAEEPCWTSRHGPAGLAPGIQALKVEPLDSVEHRKREFWMKRATWMDITRIVPSANLYLGIKGLLGDYQTYT